jgi:excisionase family DNA binding protein
VQDTTNPLLTVREAAARLSVNERTIRREIHAGRLPALKVAGAVRIDPDELEAYLYGEPQDAA